MEKTERKRGIILLGVLIIILCMTALGGYIGYSIKQVKTEKLCAKIVDSIIYQATRIPIPPTSEIQYLSPGLLDLAQIQNKEVKSILIKTTSFGGKDAE